MPPGVDTRSSAVGEVVDRTRIQELPLNEAMQCDGPGAACARRR